MELFEFVKEQRMGTEPLKGKVGIFFIDTETGGLDPLEAPLLQVGIAYVNKKDLSKVEGSIEVTNFLSQGEFGKCHPKALEVNGFTYQDILTDGDPEAEQTLIDFVQSHAGDEPFVVMFQNPKFDIEFLKVHMPELYDVLRLYDDELVFDLRDFYSMFVAHRFVPFLGYRSLKNICLALGVEPENEVHKALGGVMAMHRAFVRLKWIHTNREALKDAYYESVG